MYAGYKYILALLLATFLLLRPGYLNASTWASVSISSKQPLTKIVSITAEDSKDGTTVKIFGNGRIPGYITEIIRDPLRIVVDIPTSPQLFQSMKIPVRSSTLKGVRVGYHPNRIRVVLDIQGAEVSLRKTTSAHNGLTISLKPQTSSDESEKAPSQEPYKQSQGEMAALGNLVEIERDGDGGGVASGLEGGASNPKTPNLGPRGPVAEKLTLINADDGKQDTASFKEAVRAFLKQDWEVATRSLNQFIHSYPNARYTEKAYFLLPKAYEKLNSGLLSSHLTKIRAYYQDAITTFPTSEYVPDALLSIGDLCFKTENYHEALGYYNLVLRRQKNSPEALRALMQKARVLSLRKKDDEALSVLEYITSNYPDYAASPEITRAKIEMARILYEKNSFNKSLKILSQVVSRNPKNVYQYPEISLYLGYNQYQLGDSQKARENLLRFYNSCPDREINHLVFTKIADTYRDEGLTQEGVKFYQLVLQRYPDSEGALISRIRLAEQQEEGKLQIERGIAPNVKIIGTEIGLPREIYENIMKNLVKKDKKNPLAELALLKLAILYHKEKDFDKSLKALKDLLAEYPWTSLRKESKHVLLETIEAILREEMEMRRYSNVVNIYQKEKDLFLMINSPNAFLSIARASFFLDIEDLALEMFQRADVLLADNEKPPDLLLSLSDNSIKKKDFEDALKRLNLLTDLYPADKKVPYAYEMKGKILSRQKKHEEAAKNFSSALKNDLSRCDRARIFVEMAEAWLQANDHEKALEATREADELKDICYMDYRYIYQDIGNLYLHLGYPKEALPVLTRALEIEKGTETRIMLKFKIAQCYKRLDKKKECLALYNEISALHDPFWSNLARERIDEIEFDRQIKDNPFFPPPTVSSGRTEKKGLDRGVQKRGS